MIHCPCCNKDCKAKRSHYDYDEYVCECGCEFEYDGDGLLVTKWPGDKDD